MKSDFASVKFEELDVEIPANNRRGLLTTVEGLVGNAIDDLGQGQEVRKHMDEDLYNKIQTIIDTLESYQDGRQSFTMTIDDPSGNSYIENKCLPAQDPQLTLRWYVRTPEQNATLGLSNDQSAADQALATRGDDDEEPSEILTFPSNCSNCNSPSETNMHVLDIPHFKEVVIMATNCEHCGYKSNEVKAGGPISAKGKRITLKITDTDDLSRDILKVKSRQIILVCRSFSLTLPP